MPNKRIPTPIGVTGLKTYGDGRIWDEWLPELQSTRGQRVYREMRDNDPIIGGILFAIEMLIRQVTWTVKPADDSADGQQAAQFIEEALHDMEATWPDTLSEILSFLWYGWSYHEITYKHRGGSDTDDPVERSKYSDGLIGWRAFALRGQESLLRWEYDKAWNLVGMHQLGPPDWTEHLIPLTKALHFRTSIFQGSPEGRSILRNAYRPWYFKKHIETIEGIGIERDLAGLPTIYLPPEILAGATPEAAAALAVYKELVTNIRRDEQEGILMPMAYDDQGHELYKLELLSSGGTRQFDTDKIVSRYDQRIAMVVLADFILLGHEQTGSYALGKSKTSLMSLALTAWLDSISATVAKAFPTLLRMNGRPSALAPSLHHGDIEQADLVGLAAYLTSLNGAGLLPKDSSIIKHLLDAASLPVPDELELAEFVDQANAAREQAMAAAAQPAAGVNGNGSKLPGRNGAASPRPKPKGAPSGGSSG